MTIRINGTHLRRLKVRIDGITHRIRPGSKTACGIDWRTEFDVKWPRARANVDCMACLAAETLR